MCSTETGFAPATGGGTFVWTWARAGRALTSASGSSRVNAATTLGSAIGSSPCSCEHYRWPRREGGRAEAADCKLLSPSRQYYFESDDEKSTGVGPDRVGP